MDFGTGAASQKALDFQGARPPLRNLKKQNRQAATTVKISRPAYGIEVE